MTEDQSAWIHAAAQARAEIARYDLPDVDSLAQGYALQDGYVAALDGAVGGFKLAVNGAAQMAHFNVQEPVWARILTDEIHASGAVLPRAGFSEVSIEPELAAVLGAGVETLSGLVDRAAAMAAIDRFHAAIELIDQRGYLVPQLQLPQAVALNVFNAGIVLGDAHIAPDALAPETLTATLDIDGDRAAEVTGAAPQDPIDAVMWLLNQLQTRGVAAKPGMVVMCGTHMPLKTLTDDIGSVSVSMTGLGSVSFTLGT